MAKDVVVRISAQDAASPIFRQVGSAATAMGGQVEQSAERSGRSFDRFSKGAAAMGAAIGSATLLMGEFTRAAAEDEANQARLQQAVANTGKAYDDYADKIDVAIKKGQEKAFSDDETRDALVALNLVTNDTGESLDQLGLAMDFARAKGIDLSTSAQIIAKVYGGNLGILTRYGIVLDENATATEALAAVQARSAGQAETYANTSLGKLDQTKDKIAELTESWGAHAGAMQTVLLLLPGLQAGYVALAAAMAGMGGMAGFAKLATLLPPLAAGVAAAGTYNMVSNFNRPGGSATERLYAQGIGMVGDLTGWEGASALSRENLSRNDVESALAGAFYVPPTIDKDDTTKYLLGRITSNGYGPPNNPGASQQDITDYVNEQASMLGMTVGQYIAYKFGAADSGYVVDPVSGKFVFGEEYSRLQRTRTIESATPGQGNYYGTGSQGLASTPAVGGVTPEARAAAMRPNGSPMEFDPSAMNARAGGVPEGGGSGFLLDAAESAEKATAALKETYGAYYDLMTGMTNAGEAAEAFKYTQDELIEKQGVYGQQISEFSSQQSALTDAYDILTERRDAGVELSKEEQALLENYPGLYERITGGVDDATVAQGLLAASYIENMGKSDEYKASLDTTNSSVSSLTEMIRLFILSLDGVPDEVRTQLLLMGADTVHAQLDAAVAHLNEIDGQTATFYINTVGTGIAIGNPNGPSISAEMNGGTIGFMNGGTAYDPLMPRFANGGTWALVGEVGPEIVKLSRGDQVMPTGASRSRWQKRGGGGGDTWHINAPMTVVAPNPRQWQDAVREEAIGSSRL